MRGAHRQVEIDALKIVGIVTVVFIHSIRPAWDPGVTALEVFLGHVTRFGVPAFLFASGFLYASNTPPGVTTTARRLRRVLLPYLIASAAAFYWHAALGTPSAGGDLALDLAFGSAFGPYYFVFVITVLVLVTPLFARLSRRALVGAALLAVALQWCVDVASLGMLPLYWHLRSPLLWWAFFLVGWWVALSREAVARWLVARRRALRGALLPTVAALTALSGMEGEAPRLLVRGAAWLNIWAILALTFSFAGGWRPSPRALRLSDASYAIYLFHLFFVYAAQRGFPAPAGTLAALPVLVPLMAGLAGPLLLVMAARALLGDRARDVIGA